MTLTIDNDLLTVKTVKKYIIIDQNCLPRGSTPLILVLYHTIWHY